MGHNLCLDMFGPPSDEEAEAGLTVHGESSVAPYDLRASAEEIRATARLPLAGLSFERRIRLRGAVLHFHEVVENFTALDRPLAWTQHVTLGPPFIEGGVTEVTHSGVRSQVYEPLGGVPDRKVFSSEARSAGFATHLMDPQSSEAFFSVVNPRLKVRIGYCWRREDFPWLGIWEENRLRKEPPWSARTVTWGMEFGASPFPETRRAMIDRGSLFGVSAYQWLTAKGRISVEYTAAISDA
jgi:hypothetical protein